LRRRTPGDQLAGFDGQGEIRITLEDRRERDRGFRVLPDGEQGVHAPAHLLAGGLVIDAEQLADHPDRHLGGIALAHVHRPVGGQGG
jgi:hypothetical protein